MTYAGRYCNDSDDGRSYVQDDVDDVRVLESSVMA